jgi:P-type Cu+ transporter
VVVAGEWLGLISAVTEQIPWPIMLALVLAGGFPIFRNVIRAALQGKVLAHTLMTVGVLAAILVGEWATAAVIVFLMRAGDYAERFTTERARRAVKDLASMAPQTARVERDGQETKWILLTCAGEKPWWFVPVRRSQWTERSSAGMPQ